MTNDSALVVLISRLVRLIQAHRVLVTRFEQLKESLVALGDSRSEEELDV